MCCNTREERVVRIVFVFVRDFKMVKKRLCVLYVFIVLGDVGNYVI